MKLFLTFLVCFVFCVQLMAQQPGSLDNSFGDKGKVVNKTFNGDIKASLLQPDGKIVTGGAIGGYFRGEEFITGALVARYNKDGTPDLSFGDSGRAVTDFGDNDGKQVYGLALQKDGKILAAVYYVKNTSLSVIRLNTDGSTDKNFGKNGLASMLDPEMNNYRGEDMTLLPDGRIIIAGNVNYGLNENYSFLTCFTSDGVVDNNFGFEGTAYPAVPNKQPVIVNCVTATKEGKILTGGQYLTSDKTLIWRFNGNGTPDETFGRNGVAEMVFERRTYTPKILDIAVAEDNSITGVGCAYPNRAVYSSYMVSRFLENGTTDSSFGTNGYTLTKYGSQDADNSFEAIALQNNGRIVCAGSAVTLSGVTTFTTLRYDKDGILDSTFGENGIVSTSFTDRGLTSSSATSVFLQPDGKIVTSGFGTTDDSKYYTALARYNGDDKSPRQQIITRIRRWLQHHGITWQTDNSVRYYNVQRSTDGGITYRQLQKIYNSRHALLIYEDKTTTAGSGTEIYRVVAQGKDGSRSVSNSIPVSSESQVMVYPNPAQSYVTVQGLQANETADISIKDGSGNVLARGVSNGSGQYRSTLGSNMQPGTYYLNITTAGKTEVLKFVKQ